MRGLELRPVTGSEIPAIGAMWERCSLAAREPGGDVAALASLIRSPGGGTAELGVLVEDAWQRCGIGRRLVAHLITAAPARGITTLTASAPYPSIRPAQVDGRPAGAMNPARPPGHKEEARIRDEPVPGAEPGCAPCGTLAWLRSGR
jgi:GNAT superfamily N-acetyltransferase